MRSRSYERHRKRYAEDPDYRAKCIANNIAWNKANREHLNDVAQERYNSDPEYRARQRVHLWLKNWRRKGYDSSIVDEYDRKLKEQNGVCAICKQKSDRRLCLDHCHQTMMLRGLLCVPCNGGLGSFRDDPALLRATAEYVEHWRDVHRTQGGFRPVNAERASPGQSGRHVPSTSPRVSGAARSQRKRLSGPGSVPPPRPAADAAPESSERGWTSPLV